MLHSVARRGGTRTGLPLNTQHFLEHIQIENHTLTLFCLDLKSILTGANSRSPNAATAVSLADNSTLSNLLAQVVETFGIRRRLRDKIAKFTEVLLCLPFFSLCVFGEIHVSFLERFLQIPAWDASAGCMLYEGFAWKWNEEFCKTPDFVSALCAHAPRVQGWSSTGIWSRWCVTASGWNQWKANCWVTWTLYSTSALTVSLKWVSRADLS